MAPCHIPELGDFDPDQHHHLTSGAVLAVNRKVPLSSYVARRTMRDTYWCDKPTMAAMS